MGAELLLLLPGKAPSLPWGVLGLPPSPGLLAPTSKPVPPFVSSAILLKGTLQI